MFQFLRSMALIAAMLLGSEAAFALDADTADAIMPACRMVLGMAPNGLTTKFTVQDSGICIGLVEGLSYQRQGICYAPGVTVSQSIRVVVKYIDDRPERLQEDFKILALEALRAAWPCKK